MPQRHRPESTSHRPARPEHYGGADGAASRLLQVLQERGLSLGTAESLTGGSLAGRIVAVPGASQVFRGGMVSYATELKRDLLGVDPDLLDRHGPVHRHVAEQMATGARRVLGVDLALATTGVAGPSDQDGQSVGTVYLACAHLRGVWLRRYQLAGSRAQLRMACVDLALALGVAAMDSNN